MIQKGNKSSVIQEKKITGDAALKREGRTFVDECGFSVVAGERRAGHGVRETERPGAVVDASRRETRVGVMVGLSAAVTCGGERQ